jgi:hypothetical protein
LASLRPKTIFTKNILKMALKEMTVKEYAELMGCTKTAVFKAYHAKRNLPGVTSFKLIGTNYILEVDKAAIKKNLVGNRKPSKLAY